MARNPYTMLFGKEPRQVVSRYAERSGIVENFCEEDYSEQLYIITGVRGSGKTVFMTEVANDIRKQNDWIVVELKI